MRLVDLGPCAALLHEHDPDRCVVVLPGMRYTTQAPLLWFAREAAERHGELRGTGLGLPLTRRLAAILGGEVSVRSTLGEGATFGVTVPVAYPGGIEGVDIE